MVPPPLLPHNIHTQTHPFVYFVLPPSQHSPSPSSAITFAHPLIHVVMIDAETRILQRQQAVTALLVLLPLLSLIYK